MHPPARVYPSPSVVLIAGWDASPAPGSPSAFATPSPSPFWEKGCAKKEDRSSVRTIRRWTFVSNPFCSVPRQQQNTTAQTTPKCCSATLSPLTPKCRTFPELHSLLSVLETRPSTSWQTISGYRIAPCFPTMHFCSCLSCLFFPLSLLTLPRHSFL